MKKTLILCALIMLGGCDNKSTLEQNISGLEGLLILDEIFAKSLVESGAITPDQKDNLLTKFELYRKKLETAKEYYKLGKYEDAEKTYKEVNKNEDKLHNNLTELDKK